MGKARFIRLLPLPAWSIVLPLISDVFFFDEAHLNIKLRVFRLTVGRLSSSRKHLAIWKYFSIRPHQQLFQLLR